MNMQLVCLVVVMLGTSGYEVKITKWKMVCILTSRQMEENIQQSRDKGRYWRWGGGMRKLKLNKVVKGNWRHGTKKKGAWVEIAGNMQKAMGKNKDKSK